MSMDAIETTLWAAYSESRTIGARNALIEFYLPLVTSLARKQISKLPTHCGLELGDLISDAMPGLIHAIERFDVSRGWQFWTFALQRVRGSMADGMRSRDWVPRLERQRQKQGDAEPPAVASLQGVCHRYFSDLADLIPSLAKPSDEVQDVADFWAIVCRGLNRIDRLALMLYWREGLTMAEIGEQLGLSESRISQRLGKVMERLKQRDDLKDLFSSRSGNGVVRPRGALVVQPDLSIGGDELI
jgi:RNA polymerase sigma factor FliA